MTLQIEAGKYYKTRDGRKVGVVRKGTIYYGKDSFFTDTGCSILPDGREYPDWESDDDLIAEWTDTPADDTTTEGKPDLDSVKMEEG